jgi:protein-tyrosine-phosphatase
MAAALLAHLAEGRVSALSAGTEPLERVHPQVVKAMREIGIDLSDNRPQKLLDETVREADVVVTMGCGDARPFYPGKRYEDWELPDPAGKSFEEVREIRKQIEARVDLLFANLALTHGPPISSTRLPTSA